jgi:signal peptidase II
MNKGMLALSKWPWFLVSVLVVLCDQLTKYEAFQRLIPYSPKAIWPMLNLTLAFNTGAAFSFLSGTGSWGTWFFTVFSALMSFAIAIWMFSLPKTARLQLIALSLILGGAVGNLIDRVLLGHVIDFVDFYIGNYHWPVFNLADSAICIGAVVLFFSWKSE